MPVWTKQLPRYEHVHMCLCTCAIVQHSMGKGTHEKVEVALQMYTHMYRRVFTDTLVVRR